MGARVNDVADAVVAAITAAWGTLTPGAPVAPAAVQRAYAPTIGLTPDDAGSVLNGRQVYVFPSTYAGGDFLGRSTLRQTYAVTVLVVERYTGAGVAATDRDWLDGLVAFVEAAVFVPLRNPNTVLLDSLSPDPETPGAVDKVYDLDLLLKPGAFWSESTFTFFEGGVYS